jgi:hypothetical protein
MGSARGKGRRLSPLLLVQMCRSLLLAPPQTLSACGSPGCCADALRCTPSATPQSSPGHRTGSETSSLPNTLPAAAHGNSRRARSASAYQAECAPTRSAVPHTTPENAGSSVPARCRSGSLAVALARPRSHPALVSLSGWQSSYPLPRPSTPACTHPPRSAPGSPARTPLHRAESPAPTPGSPKSAPRHQRLSHSHAVFPLLSPDHQTGLPIDSMYSFVVHLFSGAAQQHMQPPIPESRLLPR